jgi:hypothetical protein
MLMITSRLHGMLDYLVGIALIAAPWLFGFADFNNFPAATWTPVIIGAFIIAMSLLTNYEYSMAKIIPLRAHLLMDFIAALFLTVSPWVLNYADYVYAPHLIVGLVVMLVVSMTVRQPYMPRYRRERYIERRAV